MQFERFLHPRAVAERGADLVAGILHEKPEAVLLLPAGSTPIPLYGELVRRARSGSLDLTRAHLFQLDELVGAAPSDERSFHGFLLHHLLKPLALAARFHGLDGSAQDPVLEIERHRHALERFGGPDLVLLGLGRNGHVAFNEPGSSLGDAARLVELGTSTIRGLLDRFPNASCPRQGITLGLKEIAAGRRIALLVTGESKAEVLAAVLHGEPSSELPATLLACHPGFVVLADEAAARI